MNDHGESSTSDSSNIVDIISNSKNKAPEKKIKRSRLASKKKALCINILFLRGIKPNTVHDILCRKRNLVSLR